MFSTSLGDDHAMGNRISGTGATFALLVDGLLLAIPGSSMQAMILRQVAASDCSPADPAEPDEPITKAGMDKATGL